MLSQDDRAQESGTVLTRRLNVQINGTLHQFANGGQEAACWTTQNGKINDIMGITELLDGTGDQASSTALLANALLHKVTVLETKNDFPLWAGRISVMCAQQGVHAHGSCVRVLLPTRDH